MARLVAICRGGEEEYPFLARQIPLYIDDSLTMVMEFPDSVAVDSNDINSPSFKQFSQYYSKLTHQDLNIALMVTSREVYSALSQFVPCVGCRRSVERLFSHLVESGSPALEPLTVKSTGMLSITKSCISDFKKLYTLFYIHGSKLNDLIDAIPKSKKNKRLIHSKIKPILDTRGIPAFCADCKNKVLRAYNILVGDLDGSKEKGYCAALFEGLCCCPHERHIHVYCETDFIAHLLGRAEPEFSGGYERRERHAKTIDIAQEEVLTCIGIHLYERLHRIWQKLRAEEQTWQVLFHLGIDALRKSFEIAVEKFEGISRLEQFFEELSEEERAKELKLEKKRQKKKNRRKNKCGNEMAEQEADNEKRVPDSVESCCQGCESHYEDENICQDPITANENMSCRCSSNTKQDLSTHSNGSDCGYSSSSEICSREGSDVACSDGICNHDEGGDNNIHICSEDGTDCCLDCWHKEDQCTNKKGKSSDLCNNEVPDYGTHLRSPILLSCLNENVEILNTSVLMQESKVYSNEENGLTKEEIQSFFEKYPTFLQERHLFRQRIKKRFFDYCHAATRRKVVGHS
uniref:Gametogenetin-binding protein 2 n=1 Tax=Periophthalmus magnuspinnatus TaxID=409849 RepID=A0A3B3ZWA7_9GOBI